VTEVVGESVAVDAESGVGVVAARKRPTSSGSLGSMFLLHCG
jgi:hypothetical protein